MPQIRPYSFRENDLFPGPDTQVELAEGDYQGVHFTVVGEMMLNWILNKVEHWFADRDEVILVSHGMTRKGLGFLMLEWEGCEIDPLFLAILEHEEAVVDYNLYIRARWGGVTMPIRGSGKPGIAASRGSGRRRTPAQPTQDDFDLDDLEVELEDDDDPLKDIHLIHPSSRTQTTTAKRKDTPMIRQQLSKYHHKLGSSPLILWFLGGLTLTLWACGSIVQIQTSEYLALGTNSRVAGVTWGIVTQPYLLITGQAPIGEATSWMYGWIVELITLVFALALTVAIHKISIANPHLGKAFAFFGTVLIFLNGWADYSSSPGASPLVQFLIALAIGGIVTVGLPLGIGLLEKGVEEL